MTLSITYAGSERAGQILLEGGIASLTSAADGTFATSGVRIEDPDGVLDLKQLQPFIVEESDCAQPRCFTGFMYDVKISRGPYRNGPGRIWELEIADLNFLLHLRVLRGAAANRPKETGSDRLTWLLSTVGMAGVVFDNGFVMANVWSYDETDYRGKYADDVLSDIVTAATAGRWVFFVYWDDSAAPGEEVSLFYGEAVSAINDSTLRISNVLSDVDDTVTFWPYQESSLDASGDAIYDGVYISYVGGTLYRQLGSTFTEFGIHRDGVYESDRNNNLTSASLHADTFLTTHAAQVDTITCVMRLPSDKVNLIEAGMRIQVRFEHIPHYDTFTWTRVTRRTLTLTAGGNDFYDVQLELSTKGINQAGGGDPGVFPAPQPCSGPPTIVNDEAGALGLPYTWDWSFTPTAGNVLLVLRTDRNGIGASYTASGWDQLVTVGPGGSGSDGLGFFGKISDGTETGIYFDNVPGGGDPPSNPTSCYVMEISGANLEDIVLSSTSGAGTPAVFTAVTPISGAPVLLISAFSIATDGVSIGSFTADANYSVIFDDNLTITTHSFRYLEQRSVASASGSYSASVTFPGGADPWYALSIGLSCSNAGNPPMPGQTVYRETIGVGDGTTTTFTTSFSYADGSLTVYVDLLDQTGAVTSFDGATGDFTLGFAPAVGELVQVTYQGR
jgi:hypothetical protein